jgi:hypothetical protein
MVIAFDFDRVISDKRIQDLAKKMRSCKIETWVITMRKDNVFNRNVVYESIKNAGIGFGNVIFCNEKPKEEMLQMINADIYIDNISDEFESIINHTNTIPLLWLNP